ncbi:Mannan endo-1,4-beta-mannosidase 5 [Morella rubra]|uniref:mannan endo-1,4-beta-mannosidase n=1 Tax=Morella rubra TaxID=262757 RepID=A0A6A1VDX1_9ROSI|nr:Mannan endo-1,4-beta-mannosidase 5 [Morella rubra]
MALVCEASIPVSSGFIQTRNSHFLLNGSPFLFNGFNSYWVMHVAVEPSERYKVTNVFREASAAGLMVGRTWAFSDGGYQALQTSPGVYDERVFQRVLTRINRVSGVAYKDDPTIMAWELMNEPRCQVDYSGKTVNGWVQEMAPFVKSIDNKHLLGIRMEGFYGDSVQDRRQYNPGYEVGTDFITTNLVKEIDFATIHAYPDAWLPGQNNDAQMAFTQRWLTSHWTDSMIILKKPLIFAEFGKSKKSPGYSISARDSFLNTIYTNIYNLARQGGTIGGGLVWQIMAEGMESYYDGYEIVLSQNPSSTSVIAQQSNKMTALEHSLTSPQGKLNSRPHY